MNSSSYTDSKVIVMTSLCLRVLGGETFTAADIMQGYGVTRRTAQRYMLALERLIPTIVQGDKRRTIRVLPMGEKL